MVTATTAPPLEFLAVRDKAKNTKVHGVIEINTRLWRDTTYGVTYYSMAVSVNGVYLFSQGLAQGDKDQARYDALQQLQKLEIVNAIQAYELRLQGWIIIEPSEWRNKRDLFKWELNG